MSALADAIAALKAAIRTGARKVAYGYGRDKREVEYRSLEEMKSVLADMEDEASGRERLRSTFVEHHR